MHLRDLIKDSLDVVDVLCNTSTSYAEFSRNITNQLEPEQIIQYQRGKVIYFFFIHHILIQFILFILAYVRTTIGINAFTYFKVRIFF